MKKKVIASSMVHLVCMSITDGKISVNGFNVDIDEAITPEIMSEVIKPKLSEALGKDAVILNWQRYEM